GSRTPGRTDCEMSSEAEESPEGGNSPPLARVDNGCSVLQAGFTKRPAAPRELRAVPAGELRERDSLVGRVDEPAVADVDARVDDLAARRVRAVAAEEDDVRGLELCERDPLRLRNLDAHRVRRPPLDHRGEVALVGVGLELVDAPHEAR